MQTCGRFSGGGLFFDLLKMNCPADNDVAGFRFRLQFAEFGRTLNYRHTGTLTIPMFKEERAAA
jgi:hypothetical protein